jgi:hypothetical protein
MKKLVLFIAIALLVVGATAAMTVNTAVATINWTGQGTNSMDCTKYGPEGGMHWVLTGAKNVTEATIYVNGDPYPSTKVVATIHFDTPYYELEGLTAYVEYKGMLAKNAQLVISDYCPGYKMLEVEKTAAGSYDRTVEWKLEKSVDAAEHKGWAGELAGESIWTVLATKTEKIDNYMVVGEIKIYNPNTFPVPFTVEDKLDDGTVAEVKCPADEVPAGETLTCTYVAKPMDAKATMNYAWVKAYVGVKPYPAEAKVEFIENLIGFDEGTLSDPRFEFEKIINETTKVEFPEKFVCSDDASMYTDGMYEFEVENWAYLNGNLKLKASAKVKVRCLLPALEVKKTAHGRWDRTVEWDLAKSVHPASHSGGPGDYFDSIWKVVATKKDSGPMNYRVFGEITIKNLAAIPQTFKLEDTLVGAREDLVDVKCPNFTVPAGETVVCKYEASQPDATAEWNIVVVTAPGNKPQQAKAEVVWKEILNGYDTGTLKDPRFKYEEEINKTTEIDFPERFYCPPLDSGKYVSGLYSFEEYNTAYLNGNLNLEKSAKVTVVCKARFKGETAWAANGDTAGQLPYPGANWATYVKYDGVAKTTTLFAGQTIPVGKVHFSAPKDGKIKISIELEGKWVLANVLENLKVQDYKDAPTSSPSPGLFDWKKTCSGTTCSIEVPLNDFYGVHVEVGYWY